VGGGLNSVFSDAFVDLDLRLDAMDQQKVDCHVLSLTTPMVYFAPDDFALALSQVFNDTASRAHQRYPKRFVGMTMLQMQSPKLALRELERASRLPGMRGLYMGAPLCWSASWMIPVSLKYTLFAKPLMGLFIYIRWIRSECLA
jgi:hypothetical protein